MTKLMKDELFEAQLLRAMGYAPYGGADAGECLAVAGRISGTDLDSWHDAWSAAAARLSGQAEASAGGRRRRERPERVLPRRQLLPHRGAVRDGRPARSAAGRGAPAGGGELPPRRGAAGGAAGDRADPVRGLLPAGLLLPRRRRRGAARRR